MGHALRLLVMLITLCMSAAFVQAASTAYSTADVNMREGPGTRYRVITTIPAGAAVVVHSCGHRRNWCNVSWRSARGYVFDRYLEAYADGYVPGYAPERVVPPTVIFEYDTYWDRTYKPHQRYRDRHVLPRRLHRDRGERRKFKKRRDRRKIKKRRNRRKIERRKARKLQQRRKNRQPKLRPKKRQTSTRSQKRRTNRNTDRRQKIERQQKMRSKRQN